MREKQRKLQNRAGRQIRVIQNLGSTCPKPWMFFSPVSFKTKAPHISRPCSPKLQLWPILFDPSVAQCFGQGLNQASILEPIKAQPIQAPPDHNKHGQIVDPKLRSDGQQVVVALFSIRMPTHQVFPGTKLKSLSQNPSLHP